ncbi:MAG: 30S ribosomal protein S4 [Candidatus Pacebacteria bacterium]|nr:30S ribosomal protein S4 [Candidatus Paceibacterota bacterium]
MLLKKKYKLARRLGAGIHEKTQSQKFMLSQARKAKVRGKRGKPLTDYGRQLIEKQKVRFTYGVSEKQFSNYVKRATEKTKKGVSPSEELFISLEMRLDNMVYRTGLASTRPLARQLVSHGHITVNGRKSTIPSQMITLGDKISVREASKSKTVFHDAEKKLNSHQSPKWLQVDSAALTSVMKERPILQDSELQFGTVIEFYSR